MFYIPDFHNAWEASDVDGTPIVSGVAYTMKAETPTATFVAYIGYKDIYPACNLALYEKERRKLAKYTELEREKSNRAALVNEKYSLRIHINT